MKIEKWFADSVAKKLFAIEKNISHTNINLLNLATIFNA